MNPWNIIGWFLLIILVIIPVTAFLVRLAVAIVADLREARKMRRANAGKVRCEHTEPGPDQVRCTNIATRRCPRGLACEEHMHDRRLQEMTISFAFPLDHHRRPKG